MRTAAEGDVALKLLHTADWHLGKRFPGFEPEDGRKLAIARFQAVENVFALAERYNVDAVLCAGDLFDRPRPDADEWRALARILETRGRSTRPVFLLPGNHDPLTEDSVYAAHHPFRAALPPFVTVVDRDDFEAELKGGAVLLSTPCRSHADSRDLALGLPARAPGDARLRIGLVHGQTFDMEEHQTNFPIHRNAAVERGLDYLAIGDTHGYRDVEPAAPVPTVYPGAPEPTSFGERLSGYAALVLLYRPGRKAHVEPLRVGTWSWEEVVATRPADVAALRDANRQSSVVRLILDMAVTIPEAHRLEELLKELKGTRGTSYGRVGILEVDRSRLRLSPEVRLEELPAQLPATLRATFERLGRKADAGTPAEREQAKRAMALLWRHVKEAVAS